MGPVPLRTTKSRTFWPWTNVCSTAGSVHAAGYREFGGESTGYADSSLGRLLRNTVAPPSASTHRSSRMLVASAGTVNVRRKYVVEFCRPSSSQLSPTHCVPGIVCHVQSASNVRAGRKEPVGLRRTSVSGSGAATTPPPLARCTVVVVVVSAAAGVADETAPINSAAATTGIHLFTGIVSF